MAKLLVTRDGYLEEVWQITYSNNGFDYKIFIRGTEPEMHAYVKSEFGYVGGYSACTDRELEAIEILHLKVYLAPKLGNNYN